MSVVALFAAVPDAEAANLLDVFQQASQSDPQIREAEATRLATREARPQALAAFLPQVSASGGWTAAKNGPGVTTTQSSVVTTQSTVSHGGTYGVSVTESVNIPAALLALKRTDYQLAQAELTYQSAEQSLAVRVAQRYFNVLSARDSLNSAQASLDAFNRQLEQAEKRFEVGLSAITDVQEARASRDSANAQVIAAKRTLATNQELLRELTGEGFEMLAAPGDDMPLKTPDPESEDQWVNRALEGNLDLLSSRISLELASHDLRTVRTGRYPTLNLGAAYSNQNKYPGTDFSNAANSWGESVGLTVTVPIFSGGSVSSQIRQYVYQQRAARERLERVTRETDSGTRDAFLGVTSSITQVQAYKQALDSSRLALEATQAGYEVGTRTNIDVLNSRRSLQSAETQYLQSRYTYIENIITLKQVAGTLTRADLEEINSWLTQ